MFIPSFWMRNAYAIFDDRQEGYEVGFDPTSDAVMLNTFVRTSYYQAMVSACRAK
jgi:hypothetical protein